MATVLVIGDTHCPAMKRGYVDFLKRMADHYQPDRIVHIGDLVDWYALSDHEKAPEGHDPETERKKALKQIKLITDAFPEADLLIGNHDARPIRRARAAGIPRSLLTPYSEQLNVPNWTIHEQFEEIIIDGVVYHHGEGTGGVNAAINFAKTRFRSVVQGHLHSNAGVKWHVNEEFRIFGMAVGCGADRHKLQFYYGKKLKRKPVLGCGVVIDGYRGFFEPWKLKSR